MTESLAAAQYDVFSTRPPDHDGHVRRPKPRGEREIRDRTLERLEKLRAGYLMKVRGAMVLLYWKRAEGKWRGPDGTIETRPWCSGDDAREAFESITPAPPPDLSRNFLGQVFRDGSWITIPGRRVLSKTKGSHANELKVWRLAEDVRV